MAPGTAGITKPTGKPAGWRWLLGDTFWRRKQTEPFPKTMLHPSAESRVRAGRGQQQHSHPHGWEGAARQWRVPPWSLGIPSVPESPTEQREKYKLETGRGEPCQMAPQPAGAAPTQPVPTFTVQTFLYPNKTIKASSLERSLGNSLQGEHEGCCQRGRKKKGWTGSELHPGSTRTVPAVRWGPRDGDLHPTPSLCLPTPSEHPLLHLHPRRKGGKQTFHLIYFIIL